MASLDQIPQGGTIENGSDEKSRMLKQLERGKSFHAIEEVQFALTWLDQSRIGPQQLEESMWSQNQKTCIEKYGIACTINSLCCFWTKLSRNCMH